MDTIQSIETKHKMRKIGAENLSFVTSTLWDQVKGKLEYETELYCNSWNNIPIWSRPLHPQGRVFAPSQKLLSSLAVWVQDAGWGRGWRGRRLGRREGRWTRWSWPGWACQASRMGWGGELEDQEPLTWSRTGAGRRKGGACWRQSCWGLPCRDPGCPPGCCPRRPQHPRRRAPASPPPPLPPPFSLPSLLSLSFSTSCDGSGTKFSPGEENFCRSIHIEYLDIWTRKYLGLREAETCGNLISLWPRKVHEGLCVIKMD